ncbi:hypothetical protein C0993_011423 [Termitomyces sp. T159_Od127]|nr:hypothetical protein C0993_011423 [Termitomyces sp. T159_Od127]
MFWGVGSFADWVTFERDFWAEFFPIDPTKSAALVPHNREQYEQGKQTLDEYFDSFQALVKQVAYPDGLQLCLMVWNSLHPALMECINDFAAQTMSRLSPDTRWPRTSGSLCKSGVSYAGCTPLTTSLLDHSALQPLWLGIPMDLDATLQHHFVPLLCWQCKKPGHFAQHYLLGLEVHYLSTVEQEELLLKLLAAKNTAGAPSPNELALELTPERSGACTPLLGSGEDF